MIDPTKRTAVVVMINASGTDPGKYANGVASILGKAATKSKPVNIDNPVDLSDYTGLYDSQPWWGEMAIIEWQGQLASFSLPADNPANSMTMLKHVEGDTFHRIRDNGEMGEAVVFDRDENGRVYRVSRNNNYSRKIR
jgi:hypothetical protein